MPDIQHYKPRHRATPTGLPIRTPGEFTVDERGRRPAHRADPSPTALRAMASFVQSARRGR